MMERISLSNVGDTKFQKLLGIIGIYYIRGVR